MSCDRSVVVIGIRCNRIALQYKWLSSAMSRVADSHPEEQGSKPALSIFFLMGPFLWVYYTTYLFKAGNHVVLMIKFTEFRAGIRTKHVRKINHTSTNTYSIIMQ